MEPLRPEDPREVGPYRLLSRLGDGGMGRVYLGRSPGGRQVAVKLLRTDTASGPEFRRRFAQEIEAARRVGGFHTAQVVDADPAADPPWLVTAYVEGPSLDEAVQRYGPLPVATVRRLAAGLVEGLRAIHACGLVHRDLKPGNILLATDGPRIIDFGIVRTAGTTRLTSADALIGTPGFMSPEQATGNGEIGPASDVFSLGSVLAYASSGRGPFDSSSVAMVLYRIYEAAPTLDGVPAELRDVVEACLAKVISARPSVPQLMEYFAADADITGEWLPQPVTGMIAAQRAVNPLPATPLPAPPPAWTPAAPSAPSWQTPPPRPYASAPVQAPMPYTEPMKRGGARRSEVALAAAAIAVIVLLVGGLGAMVIMRMRAAQPDRDPPSAPQAAPTSATDPHSSSDDPPDGNPGTSVAGTWTGTYTCNQGLTRLRLVITQPGGGKLLRATFNFSADPSNPSVPSGSYLMEGAVGAGSFTLRGVRWIRRPGDYVMVGLSASVTGSRPSRIRGTVNGASCTNFEVRRT